ADDDDVDPGGVTERDEFGGAAGGVEGWTRHGARYPFRARVSCVTRSSAGRMASTICAAKIVDCVISRHITASCLTSPDRTLPSSCADLISPATVSRSICWLVPSRSER